MTRSFGGSYSRKADGGDLVIRTIAECPPTSARLPRWVPEVGGGLVSPRRGQVAVVGAGEIVSAQAVLEAESRSEGFGAGLVDLRDVRSAVGQKTRAASNGAHGIISRKKQILWSDVVFVRTLRATTKKR